MAQKTDDFKSFSQALRKEVKDNFTKTPVHYPNQPDQDFNKPDEDAWVRMSIQEGDAIAIDFGSSKRTYRHPGIIVFEIYAPTGDFEDEVDNIADDLASIFRGQAIDTTRFRAPSLENVGRVNIDQGSWFRKDLTVPFRSDRRFNI